MDDEQVDDNEVEVPAYAGRFIRQKKKKMLCCPYPTDRKMRKNGVVFFFKPLKKAILYNKHSLRVKITDL